MIFQIGSLPSDIPGQNREKRLFILLNLFTLQPHRVYQKNVHPFKFKLTVIYCSNLTAV